MLRYIWRIIIIDALAQYSSNSTIVAVAGGDDIIVTLLIIALTTVMEVINVTYFVK